MYSTRQAQKGEVIFKENSTGMSAFVVKSGMVEISKQIGPKRVVLAILRENNIFGEMALLGNGKRTAQALALESCELLEFNQDVLKDLLHQAPKIVQALCLNLLSRLKSTSERIRPSLADSPFFSLCSLLELMARDRQTGEFNAIPYKIVVQQVYDVLNLPVVEIERVLKQMHMLNLIDINTNAKHSREVGITDGDTFLTRARAVANEFGKAMGLQPEQQTELIGLDNFASLLNIDAKRIYAKMAEGKVPENLFLFHRGEAVRWAAEVGKEFFEPTPHTAKGAAKGAKKPKSAHEEFGEMLNIEGADADAVRANLEQHSQK